MPRACLVCTHPDGEKINLDLTRPGLKVGELSKKYKVSQDSLTRHKANHLVRALVAAVEPDDLPSDMNLLDQLQNLQAKTLQILRRAELGGNQRMARQKRGQV